MLVARLARSPGWVFFGLAVMVLTVSWAIATSSALLGNPRILSIAVVLDVAVTIPAAYWFLVVRSQHAHVRAMIPIVALCIIVTSAIIPAGQARVLALARHLFAPAEIGLLVYIAYKVRDVLGSRDCSNPRDPVEAATADLQRALGNAFAARLIASEFAMLYYAVGPWGRCPRVPEHAVPFAGVRSVAVLAVLAPIVVIEAGGMHVLVSMWNVAAAWILTALNGYTMLWVLGDYRAMAMRPTFVTHDEVLIRVGLRFSLRASLGQIVETRLTDWRNERRSLSGHLNLASPDSPNILIVFREPITAQRAFGVQTRVRSVALRVQDAEGMMRALSSHQAENMAT
jgi:hypothetical protein